MRGSCAIACNAAISRPVQSTFSYSSLPNPGKVLQLKITVSIAKLRRNGRACRPFLTGALRPRRAHPRGVSAHDAAVSCHAGDAGLVSTVQRQGPPEDMQSQNSFDSWRARQDNCTVTTYEVPIWGTLLYMRLGR
jgi:hypothetical protein